MSQPVFAAQDEESTLTSNSQIVYSEEDIEEVRALLSEAKEKEKFYDNFDENLAFLEKICNNVVKTNLPLYNHY